MQHYFDNYDGVVSIPKVPDRYDTSGDADITTKLQDETPLSLLSTDGDEGLARKSEQEGRPETDGDAEIARRLEAESRLQTDRDAELARQLAAQAQRPSTNRDAETARRLQSETPVPSPSTSRTPSARARPPPTSRHVRHLSDQARPQADERDRRMQEQAHRRRQLALNQDFAGLTLAPRRRQRADELENQRRRYESRQYEDRPDAGWYDTYPNNPSQWY